MSGWIKNAEPRLDAVRMMIRQECWPDHHWPIWILGRDIRLPGDDATMPRQPPANDRSFTMRG